MQLSDSDKTLFKGLSQSETGKNLVSYLRRFADDLADIRTLPKDISKDHVLWFINQLEKNVIERITLQTEKKATEVNPYE